MSTDLPTQVKQLIIACLLLDGVQVSDIGDDDALFGGRFGLDSVDALELVMGIEREFGVSILDIEEDREVLATVRSIVNHVSANSPRV